MQPCDKPCSKCPWVSKDPRDIEATSDPKLLDAIARGTEFICHVDMNVCRGAHLRQVKQASK